MLMAQRPQRDSNSRLTVENRRFLAGLNYGGKGWLERIELSFHESQSHVMPIYYNQHEKYLTHALRAGPHLNASNWICTLAKTLEGFHAICYTIDL